MAKLLKLRRGTTSQHNTFTGAEGEVTIDTTKDTAVVHDGSTAGGTPLAKEDMSNVSSSSIAGRLGADSIAVTKIAAGTLPSDVKVASINIIDGSIVNSDLNAGAGITSGKLATTGVSAGSYGSSSAIPIVTVNAQGQITSASTTAIDSTRIDNGTSNVRVANNGSTNVSHAGTDRLSVTNSGVTVTGTLVAGNTTIDNGTSTTLRIKCDNGGNAVVRAGGEGQGTGAIEVTQDEGNHGGGISYNGDGSPSFVSGETADHVTFYRINAGTRSEVFHYSYSLSLIHI